MGGSVVRAEGGRDASLGGWGKELGQNCTEDKKSKV